MCIALYPRGFATLAGEMVAPAVPWREQTAPSSWPHEPSARDAHACAVSSTFRCLGVCPTATAAGPSTLVRPPQHEDGGFGGAQ